MQVIDTSGSVLNINNAIINGWDTNRVGKFINYVFNPPPPPIWRHPQPAAADFEPTDGLLGQGEPSTLSRLMTGGMWIHYDPDPSSRPLVLFGLVGLTQKLSAA